MEKKPKVKNLVALSLYEIEAKQLPSLKKYWWFRAKAVHTRHGPLI
jgi:hypothetical protein